MIKCKDLYEKKNILLTLILGSIIFLFSVLYIAQHSSGTCDELGAHIPSGYLYLLSGKFSGGVNNSPLGQILIALPAVISHKTYRLFSEDNLFYFRITNIIIGYLLLILIFFFALRIFDKYTALLAFFISSLSPNILGYSALATLDIQIVFFILLCIFFLHSYIENETWLNLFLLSISFVLSICIKIQALILIPYILIVFGIKFKNMDKVKLLYLCISNLIFFLIVVNILYLNNPITNGIVPIEFINAVKNKLIHSSHGHFSYLFGKYSNIGWLYYFPVVLTFKTPLITLILFIFGIFKLSKDAVLFVFVPFILFLAFFIKSHINIGVRHILILYPFMIIIGANFLIYLYKKFSLKHIIIIISFLYFIEYAIIFPHQLSYFNILCLGPNNGYRVLLDSNFDWGQNDYYLLKYLKAHSQEKYRINTDPYFPMSGNLIVNANALYGILSSPKAYKWLRENFIPIDRIAYTWFVYKVPENLDKIKEKYMKKKFEKKSFKKDTYNDIKLLSEYYSNSLKKDIHKQLAIRSINIGAYDIAFSELRQILKIDPVDKMALITGGELIVRMKLGILRFKGDDYIKYFNENRRG